MPGAQESSLSWLELSSEDTWAQVSPPEEPKAAVTEFGFCLNHQNLPEEKQELGVGGCALSQVRSTGLCLKFDLCHQGNDQEPALCKSQG